MSERILRDDRDGLCTLTFNRPDKRNALDTESFEALDAHLAELERQTDTIGCVVLRGAGKGFCAGADLKAMGTAPVPPRFKPDVIQRLAALPQPVIAAVHGMCLTGGLELALACDFILADSSAGFADTHATWGLVGQWGMTQRLPRRIGHAAAKRLMMTARVISATEAHAIGLIDMVAAAGELDALVAGLARDILASSWFSNRANKKLLRETEGLSLAQGLAHEHVHHPGFAPDHAERIAGFGKARPVGRATTGD